MSLVIPAAIMLIAGVLVALRSVDARLGSAQGVRQVASNLTYTIVTVALCVAVLLVVQGIIGFNLGPRW
jgi:hypothetical protein